MATRAQEQRAETEKKGVPAKRVRKLARRKATKTARTGPKIVETPRAKRDTAAVIAHEAAATTPEARAARDQRKASRVRGGA